MDVRLDGRRAVITAGAAGIGRVTAEAMLASGARVFVCDVDEAALAEVRATLPEIGASVADVSDPAAVDRLFDEAVADLGGGLDILVNNAGIAGPTKPVEEVEPDELRRTMAVNVYGQFYCARRAVPLLRAAGGGSIVNLSSAASRFGFALRSPYSASKWAVVGFSKTLAIELGADQIRVNAICPGPIGTNLRANSERVLGPGAPPMANVGVAVNEDQLRAIIPLGRRGTVDDIAAAACFLASDAAAYITGHTLVVDGGWTAR